MRASPIHRRLRADTAELHQALDVRLDLTAAGLRLERYRAVLRMFYGGDLQLIAMNGATPDQIAAVVARPNAIFIQHTDNHSKI